MKIKKFDNIWIMGLILCGAILVFLYMLKIFFPSFVVETAQSEKICKIGNYIDTHKWAWYLASSVLSFIVMSLLCCSACRKKTLNWKEILIIVADIAFMYIIKAFLPKYYTAFNYISMILLPCIMGRKVDTYDNYFCEPNARTNFYVGNTEYRANDNRLQLCYVAYISYRRLFVSNFALFGNEL